MKTLHTTITGPFRHENLEIFFLCGNQQIPDQRFIPLHEGLDQGLVVVHETGQVGRLEVENLAEVDLFIQAGDVVKGGKQDRTMAVDLLVAPRGGRTPIPAFCVEASRWHRRNSESVVHFSKSDSILASKDLRLSAKLSKDQGAVWNSVKQFQSSISASLQYNVQSEASPTSYQLSMEQGALKKRRRDYADALESLVDSVPEAIGFVFAINGKLNSADVYGSHDLFRRLWSRQLDAAVTEAVLESQMVSAEAQRSVPLESVEMWLDEALSGRQTDQREVGEGVNYLVSKTRRSVLFETLCRGEEKRTLHRNVISLD